ncbi:MAG: type IV secretion system DNA-binding domain-containing protein [Janthinobacterium lividum]
MSERDYLQIIWPIGLASLSLIYPAWKYGIEPLLPADQRLSLLGLGQLTYEHLGDPSFDLGSWPTWLTAALIPSVVGSGVVVSLIQHRWRGLIMTGAISMLAAGISGAVMAYRPPDNLIVRMIAMPVAALMGAALGMALSSPAQQDTLIRGTSVTVLRKPSRRAVRRLVAQGRIVLAGAVLGPLDEGRHVLVIGSTGTGKSTVLMALFGMTLARGDRHVVVDPSGLALKRFHRTGDVILNPFDPRSAAWDLLAEIEHPNDYVRLAEILLPASASEGDQSWTEFARTLLASCMRGWHTLQIGNSAEFFRAMAAADKDVLAPLCIGTGAESYFAEGNVKMLAGIVATMNRALGPMAALADVSGPAFSVRKWLREGTGTLWMPYQNDQIASLKGLISCWMSLAITETLSLAPSDTRRIWFHVDELDALGPIQGLKDALTRLRKFGGRVVLGVQSIAQVSGTYGMADARTITENCGNVLILRCASSEGGGTAKYASELIGEREVERDQVTTSSSDGRNTSSSASTSQVRLREAAVMPAELMQLPDRTGYLKVATTAEWQKVSF